MNNTEQLTSSVIICTRNRLDDMVVCLQSLAKQVIAPTEIIIVDSSDTPLNQQSSFSNVFTSEYFPATRCVYEHSAPGAALQRNIGSTLATGNIYYFFDDDTYVSPHYIQRMNIIFARRPEYGGGMGCVTNVPAKQQSFDRVFRAAFLLQRDYAAGTFTSSGMPTHVYGTHTFKDIEVLGGCCMAYRADVFHKHLFDETLGRYSYMEDCDLSFRASRTCKLFYLPDAKLEHYHSPANRDRLQETRALFIRNYSYLFFKNFYPQNRLKIFAYMWTILGLFLQAFYLRSIPHFKGYCVGLKRYYWDERR